MRIGTLLLATIGIATLALGRPASADLTGAIRDGAVASQTAARVDPVVSERDRELPDRPRVFMAFTGNNALANNASFDDQWREVRQSLDGWWGNPVGMSGKEIGRLVSKTRTRSFIGEMEVPADPRGFSLQSFAYIERENPGLRLDREGIVLYAPDPSRWNGLSIDRLRQESTDRGTDGRPLFPAIYTGWQPWNFEASDGRFIGRHPAADRALDSADGHMVECPNDACISNQIGYGPAFRRAIDEAHANGRPFIWFASRAPDRPCSSFLPQFQRTYDAIRSEGRWRRGDVVVIIEYTGQCPVVPEARDGVAANTITGAAYWALQQ